MSNIVIIDYGLGNVFNVKRAIQAIGKDAIISSDQKVIRSASHLILPGVGAFAEGMRQLNDRNLVKVIKEEAFKGQPILGICLGMQLLLSSSDEFGYNKGLDIIPGNVKYFKKSDTKKYKIPHIGWSKVSPPTNSKEAWKNTIFKDLGKDTYMYFVHSLYASLDSNLNQLSETTYGDQHFTSAIVRGNVNGCQFHPERSGEEGLKILKNFVNIN